MPPEPIPGDGDRADPHSKLPFAHVSTMLTRSFFYWKEPHDRYPLVPKTVA
jgi:hypothetical protein